jgi:hypothetical protein
MSSDFRDLNMNALIMMKIMLFINEATDPTRRYDDKVDRAAGISKRQIRRAYNGKKLNKMLDNLVMKEMIIHEQIPQKGKDELKSIYRLTVSGQDTVKKIGRSLIFLIKDF